MHKLYIKITSEIMLYRIDSSLLKINLLDFSYIFKLNKFFMLEI